MPSAGPDRPSYLLNPLARPTLAAPPESAISSGATERRNLTPRDGNVLTELAGGQRAGSGRGRGDQRSSAEQLAGSEMDRGGVEQLEFVWPHRQREFGFQRQTRFDFLPDRAFEHDMTAATGRLGAGQREMAVAQQFVRGVAAGGIHRRADRDPDMVLAVSAPGPGIDGRPHPPPTM